MTQAPETAAQPSEDTFSTTKIAIQSKDATAHPSKNTNAGEEHAGLMIGKDKMSENESMITLVRKQNLNSKPLQAIKI